MEGGRIIHIWCTGVDGHTYARLSGAGMEVVVGRHAGQSQEGLVACRETPEHIPSVR